jgi:hypothetical protein
MRYSTVGGPRRVTDEQVRRILQWKSFREWVKEVGVSYSHGNKIRNGHFRHKKRSP